MSLRTLFTLAIPLLFTILSFANAQDCSVSNPCAHGCCNDFGFCGYGPDCCDSKSECDPGGFGTRYANQTTCPLRVCCSEHGFCGTTEAFCGDKRVQSPDCKGKSRTHNRVIGYYEGWATGRQCDAFYPEQIPLGVYSHINFAFATVDPVTFEVRPANPGDVQLYERLVYLKRQDPNLKVFIAIGGWTFNDPGPTATTFSDIARSHENQIKFILSLASFMGTYGFDGVDLDWEYPRATDRSGRPEDYENFPQFLANLRFGLSIMPGKPELSITIPASYWYLQHFDLQAMEPWVDWFNVMSYDLHGVWDIPNKWVGPWLNAHTNLTEIDLALDLLWRNKVDPEKVVLGLAFYARAFIAESSSCMTPGCKYGSGTPPWTCSNEVGVVLNSEIDYLIKTFELDPPVLDEEAAVKILTWKDYWIAYDDEETLKTKSHFAADKCLGGVMVWAISHDTKDAKFSKALATAVARPGGTWQEDTVSALELRPQCKWTNCGQPCPSGYVTVPRVDEHARPGEIMLDDQGCEGHGSHVYCCPPDKGIPTCGWYGHRNGNCQGACPADKIEIGSNNMFCKTQGFMRTKGYQAACCSVEEGIGSRRVRFENMALQNQCRWGNWPLCDGECQTSRYPNVLFTSWEGSGGATCWNQDRRPFCCDQQDDDLYYDECDWYNNMGGGPSGTHACKSGCPESRIRLGMESCSTGSKALCCTASSKSLQSRGDEVLEKYGDIMDAFLGDPSCSSDFAPDRLLRRDAVWFMTGSGGNDGNETDLFPTSLARRQLEEVSDQFIQVVERVFIVDQPPTLGLLTLWDSRVGTIYPYLVVDRVQSWLRSNDWHGFFRGGTGQMIKYIGCNLEYLNSIFKSEDSSCSVTIPRQCSDPDAEGSGLQKRARTPIQWLATVGGITYTGQIHSAPYPTANQFDVDDPTEMVLYRNVYHFPSPPCTNFHIRKIDMLADIRRHGVLDPRLPTAFATEHIIELQTISRWYSAAMMGLLADGRMASGAVEVGFFQATMVHPQYGLQDELMAALGSMTNRANFLVAESQLNCMKADIWAFNNAVAPQKMNSYLRHTRDDADVALTNLRNAVSIISYLNDPTIHKNMANILTAIRAVLKKAEKVHLDLTQRQVHALQHFDEFMVSQFKGIESAMRAFVDEWGVKMQNLWKDVDTPLGRDVMASLSIIIRASHKASIDMKGLT